jgi:hypothetical protein
MNKGVTKIKVVSLLSATFVSLFLFAFQALASSTGYTLSGFSNGFDGTYCDNGTTVFGQTVYEHSGKYIFLSTDGTNYYTVIGFPPVDHYDTSAWNFYGSNNHTTSIHDPSIGITTATWQPVSGGTPGTVTTATCTSSTPPPSSSSSTVASSLGSQGGSMATTVGGELATGIAKVLALLAGLLGLGVLMKYISKWWFRDSNMAMNKAQHAGARLRNTMRRL